MGIHPVVDRIEFAEFVFENGVEECGFSVGSKGGKKREGIEREQRMGESIHNGSMVQWFNSLNNSMIQ